MLARLYERELSGAGAQYSVNVGELMGDLTDVVPPNWPWEAVTWIVEQGYGMDFRTSGGNAETILKPEGRLYVERAEGLIADYRSSPQIVVTVGDGNRIAVGHGQ